MKMYRNLKYLNHILGYIDIKFHNAHNYVAVIIAVKI